MISMSSGMSELWNKRKPIDLPQALKVDYIDNGFSVVDDCVFFKQEWGGDLTHVELSVVHSFCDDVTGYECSINRLHIEDYCEARSNADLANVSFAFLESFSKLWRSQFHFSCVAILSIQFEPILDVDEVVPVATFRFHKKRKGEVWADPNDVVNSKEYILSTVIEK